MPPKPDQITQAAWLLALQAGLGEEGARVLLAILQTEGGLSGAVGDDGQSFGPLQFYTQGQLPNYAKARGLSLQQAGERARQEPVDAIEWALQTYLGRAIRSGLERGLRGPDLATYAQRTGQVSESPERAGASYRALWGQGQGAAREGASVPGDTTSVKDESIQELEKAIAAEEAKEEAAFKRMAELQDKLTALQEKAESGGSDAWLAADQAKILQAQYTTQRTIAESAANRKNRLIQDRERIRTQPDRDLDRRIKEGAAGLAEKQHGLDERQTAVVEGRLALDIQKERNDQIRQQLAEQVAAGRLTLDQARERWDQVLAQSQTGIDATLKALAERRQGMSRYITPDMARAVKGSVASWNQFGAQVPTDWDIPITPYTDPYEAIKPYMPPPPSAEQWSAGTDWQTAQKAMLAGPRAEPQPTWMQDAMMAQQGGYGRATAPNGAGGAPAGGGGPTSVTGPYEGLAATPPAMGMGPPAGQSGSDLPSGYRPAPYPGPRGGYEPQGTPGVSDVQPLPPGGREPQGTPGYGGPALPATFGPERAPGPVAEQYNDILMDMTIDDEEKRRRLRALGLPLP